MAAVPSAAHKWPGSVPASARDLSSSWPKRAEGVTKPPSPTHCLQANSSEPSPVVSKWHCWWISKFYWRVSNLKCHLLTEVMATFPALPTTGLAVVSFPCSPLPWWIRFSSDCPGGGEQRGKGICLYHLLATCPQSVKLLSTEKMLFLKFFQTFRHYFLLQLTC